MAYLEATVLPVLEIIRKDKELEEEDEGKTKQSPPGIFVYNMF